MKVFKGFSTRGYAESGRLFDIYNVDLVEEDILNEIFTTYGERIHMPKFGTRIPQLSFEINDKVTMDVIKEDILKVVNNEPRVKLLGMNIVPIPDSHSIGVFLKLLYVEFNVTKDLNIEIQSK